LRSTPRTETAPLRAERRTSVADRFSDRGLVDGVASARAGHYKEAAANLSSTATRKNASPQSKYYLAQSLERSGQTARAAQEYLSLSRGRSGVSHASYLAYCMMLSRMGQREKARALVQHFIRQNPDSSQVVDARRLLQMM
jgi:TolA-binding protein